jgi:hypothetical protein
VPKVTYVNPTEVEVGYMTEVYAMIDPKIDGNKRLFFEPFPTEMGRFGLSNDPQDQATS